MQKADGAWRLTVDSHKFNQVMTPIAAAISDVVSLLEQISISPSSGYATTFSYIPVHEAVCFQLAWPAIHRHCPMSVAYQLSSPVP